MEVKNKSYCQFVKIKKKTGKERVKSKSYCQFVKIKLFIKGRLKSVGKIVNVMVNL
jgi:hypothetical protein